MDHDESGEPMLAKASGAVDSSISAAVNRTSRQAYSLIPSNATPETIADEILSLLSNEHLRTARRMAEEAHKRFPGHDRIRRIWGIFDNRGKARKSSAGVRPWNDGELEWLRDPPEWAAGKWVALLGSEAVASADSLDELMESVNSQDSSKSPLVVRV